MQKTKEINQKKKQYFAVVTKQGTTKIKMDDILYFEKDLRRIHVHTTEGIYSFYGSFENLEKMIDYRFCRCHYSVVVNLSKIDSLERYSLRLESGENLTISQRKYPSTRTRYRTFLQKI